MFKLLPIIVVIAMLGVAYYAWQQYQGIQRQLSELDKSGVDISYQLKSRPAVVFDKHQQRIYIVYADRFESMGVDSIREIIIYRSERLTERKHQDDKVMSRGQLIDSQGVIHRFSDYESAKQAMSFFKNTPINSDKIRLINTK